MKAAFHFSASTEGGGNYALHALGEIFTIIFKNNINILSKISFGDLLLFHHSYQLEEDKPNEQTYAFDSSKYEDLFTKWLTSARDGWFRMTPEHIEQAWGTNIFAVCLDTISKHDANILDEKLLEIDGYLGAFEVSDTYGIYWVLYSQSITPKYRICGKDLYLFWDEMQGEDSKDEGMLTYWNEFGFSKVSFQSLNMKGTIFDACDTFEHAQLLARWRDQASHLLTSVVDNIVYQLSDAAPDLGKKLCGAVDAYFKSSTTEDFAHVALSCRRIVEYISDIVFEPIPGGGEGKHKLGKNQFKNRLLAFAERERKSDTSIDLVNSSMNMLNEQLEKILELQNKGLHDEIIQSEARRCIIRTMMIIDDILCLRKNPLPVKTKYTIPWLGE